MAKCIMCGKRPMWFGTTKNKIHRPLCTPCMDLHYEAHALSNEIRSQPYWKESMQRK